MTLRHKSVEFIVDLAAETGLHGIEWGGDVHVPHGDVALATDVGAKTRDAGLKVSSYGAYYRVAHSENDGLPFAQVLASATALGAPMVRVWCGKQGSATADADYWRAIIVDSQRITAMAADAGVVLSYEFHAGTVNDTPDSTRRLMEAVANPNLKTHWQTEIWDTSLGDVRAHNLAVLKAIRPWLSYVHTYHYEPNAEGRWAQVALAQGADDWAAYLAALDRLDTYLLLEHVCNHDPDLLRADVATLHALIGQS